MNKKNLTRIAFSGLFLMLAVFFLLFYESESVASYQTNQGNIFGTYYRITYQSKNDYHKDIITRLKTFDTSLSMFNKESIIARINRNEQVQTDADFEHMYAIAERIATLSNGAFDITVAPLVNAWGFGFKNKDDITAETIDSLLQYIGFANISLVDKQVIKTKPNIMLDAGAIAKGQACDIVAELLEQQGIHNYLIDIGGEIVAQGVNQQGKNWQVGIVTPIDDPQGTNNQLQEVISAPRVCMATSGNYRQFYYENGERRSHTIDPRTGYPVNHNLLSATVIAPSCIEADAIATACMVLGTLDAMEMVAQIENVECYLIYATPEGNKVAKTLGIDAYILETK